MKIAVIMMILVLGTEGLQFDPTKYKTALWNYAVDLIKDYLYKETISDEPYIQNEDEKLDHEWEKFKLKFDKIYSSENHEQIRKLIFKENLDMINSHNNNPQNSFQLGINFMADFTKDDVRRMNNLKLSPQDLKEPTDSFLTMMSGIEPFRVPESLDWREKGAVTKVKNQGQCGSCWAYGAVGVMEGCHQRKTGELVDLSPQSIVDCWKYGCNGGNGVHGFDLAKRNNGTPTEKDYPYEMRTGQCRLNVTVVPETVKNYGQVAGGEYGMKIAIALYGPVMATVHASEHSFTFYSRGIYTDKMCNKSVDHAVVIVGYGATEDGREYWIVKNSWGRSWGEKGYMRLGRNMGNLCRVASYSHFITC